MLVLLTRVLLWASVGLLIWYILTKVIDKKYLTWFGGVILIVLLVASFIDPQDGTISVIWRILSFPLTPLGAVIVFLGISLSGGTKNFRATPAAIALAILLIFSIPVTAKWLISDAEQAVAKAYEDRSLVCDEVCRSSSIPPGEGNLRTAAAIVVIGDSSDIKNAMTVFNNNNTDNVSVNTPLPPELIEDVSVNTSLAPRLRYAANLYRQARDRNAAPVVIVTAGNPDEAKLEESTIIRNILVNNGVFGEDIQIERTGLDVYRTAERVEDTLQKRQVINASRDARREQGTKDDPRVFLVAPAIVMSRAALTFEKLELQVVAKPTDFYTAKFSLTGSTLNSLPDLLPSVDALQLTTRYWDELRTSLYYFLRGWLPGFNFGWDSSIEI
jgi:uncharacterized SAM-binding protein YcdF (DUF218 family)